MRCLCLYVAYIFVCVSAEMRVIDLTHPHSPDTIYWPGSPPYNLSILERGQTEDGYWFESNFIETGEHGGTHMDAPAHFVEGKWRVHQIPIDHLIGPGVVLDVKGKAAADHDYRVSVEDIQEWERRNGRIPKKAIVLMNSGWSDRYPNKTLVFNSETPSVPATFHYPSWHEDTVNWLLINRDIHMIGVDSPSNDYGQTTQFPVHILCGKNNIPTAEHVANLDQIPAKGTIVYVAAILIMDGSGGPARVFATFDDDDVTESEYRVEL